MWFESYGVVERMKIKNCYSSYQDALAQCIDSGYLNEELATVVVEKNKIYRKNLQDDPTIDTNASRILRAFSMFGRENEIRVLDFGGGAGNHHSIAKLLLPSSISLRWAIVETNIMVSAANSIRVDGLEFYDSPMRVADDFGEIDVLILSSSLQYCESPYATLEALLKLKPHRVFITRTPLSHQNDPHIVLQESMLADNGPGPMPAGFNNRKVTYPCVFEAVSKIETLILSSGYQIKYRLIEESSFRGKDGPLFAFEYLCDVNS